MQVKYQYEKLKICKWWLDRGFYLLPAQVGKKYLLQGWGEHRHKITNFPGAVGLFDSRQSLSNVAVLATDGFCILDFDDAELYEFWKNKHVELSRSYSEKTPRGGMHVFFKSCVPPGLVLVPGVEIKRVCLIAPSVVDGKPYTRGEGEIIEADASSVFSSIGKPGHKTAYRLQADEHARKSSRVGDSIIPRIKAHWTTLDVFRTYRPEIEFSGNSQIVSGRCPFHKDHKPSMFIVLETGFWKCHACGAFGDVIDAYARLEAISNREAIARMARALGVQA